MPGKVTLPQVLLQSKNLSQVFLCPDKVTGTDPQEPILLVPSSTVSFGVLGWQSAGPQVLFSVFSDTSKRCRGEHRSPEALSVTEEVAGECICPFHTDLLPHSCYSLLPSTQSFPSPMVIPTSHSCLSCLPNSIFLSPGVEKGLVRPLGLSGLTVSTSFAALPNQLQVPPGAAPHSRAATCSPGAGVGGHA